MTESMITVASDSGKLTCTFAALAAADIFKIFNIDIAKEVKKMLNDEEALGYLPGQYTFSFENKHLSIHHNDLKSELKNNISSILKKKVLYEKNDLSTRMNALCHIMNYLNLLRNKKQIYAFNIICNETNNTQQIIDNHQFKCTVGIKFSNSADEEITVLEFTIGNQTL